MRSKPENNLQIEGRPCALVFAASQRAPAYEAQARVLDEQADELAARQIVVAYVFTEGDSTVGTERIPPDDVQALRERFGVSDEDFQIVLLNDAGEVVRTDDAPLQGAAILRALNSTTS